MPKKDSPKPEIAGQPAKRARRSTAKRAKPKPTVAPEIARSEAGKRLLQTPKRIWYKPPTWRHRPPRPNYKPLPKARLLFWAVLQLLWKNWKLFGGIVLIYGLLNILLVRGLAGGSNLTDFKHTLDGVSQGFGGKVTTALTTFTYLLASSGSGNTDVSGVYQSIVFVLCSLACIWALRQVMAGHEARVRDGFYRGMSPLIPFLLLFLLLGVQLLPMAASAGLYGIAINGGIAVHIWEKSLFVLLLIVASAWSLRMVTATVFGLYIVTLPDMTPLRAYRSARQLVYRRRLLIWRKLVFLAVLLFLLAVAIEAPLIWWLTPAATWTFFILSMLALPIVHGYLYKLYRDML